jgi:hypothetical protein
MSKKTISRRSAIAAGAAVLVGSPVAFGQGKDKDGPHPRLRIAIHHLREAIDYMKDAPNNFGGHKAKAIEASQIAIRQLELALKE